VFGLLRTRADTQDGLLRALNIGNRTTKDLLLGNDEHVHLDWFLLLSVHEDRRALLRTKQKFVRDLPLLSRY